ncbi:uncharacterized protein LOC119582972 [Penaeus monodon]|uniref:uncharacterized protein LOC119582972 n=1 Tax=Penaeus monodon TaxID=6687 RepID=UPI0018A7D467|nr:uncharacterized protein LOC119582972 [Penaeus monodon]
MDLHKMYSDSRTAAETSLRRKKGAATVHVLGDLLRDKLVRKLREHKFSLIIDESTDCSTSKTLAIVAKYFDFKENSFKTEMLDMINIYNGNAEGSSWENLFNIIIKTLNNFQIPLSNVTGFAADGASNISGRINSVTSRLRQEMPGITIMKFVCHSIHLCSSEAAKALPRSCEDLVRNIYNFFAHSAKRNAVSRVLEQWQPLKLYFSNIVEEERLIAVGKFHMALKDHYICIYLNFMNYILPHLDREIDPSDPANHLPVNQIYLGFKPLNILEILSLFLQ